MPWLAYLTVIERSPNTVKGACMALKDSFVFFRSASPPPNDKPAQFDRRARNATTVNRGVPIFPGNR